jgi:diguanylate cyclase
MVDVDYFKRFNDNYGHQAGDAVLRGLAGVFVTYAREMDIVARYGGEEFAIIFPQTSAAEAAVASDRIRRAVAEASFRFDGVDLRVTASIGVAELLAGETAERLVQRADAAVYAAKSGGRNRTYWHDGQAVHPMESGEKAFLPTLTNAAR